MRRTRHPIRSAAGVQAHRCGRSPDECCGRSPDRATRAAFTLIELLVVLVIVVTLVALAVAGLQRSPADRINASARQLQSRILLARSIAARDQRISGIRLVQSANDPWVVDTVELISSPGYDIGTASVQFDGGTGRWSITASDWARLMPRAVRPITGRGLVKVGSRIEVPNGSGRWYTVASVLTEDANLNESLDDPPEDLNANGRLDYTLVLNGHYTPSAWNGAVYVAQPATSVSYRLELAATVTAGEEPLRLQPGTVIDLAGCVNVPLNREILFAPGQGLTGDNAAAGNIYLYLTTLEDVELTRNLIAGHPADSGPFDPSAPGLPIVPANAPSVPKNEPLGLAIFAQTGNVLSFAVDLTDAGGDFKADQWFSYGRSGKEVAR